MKLGAWWRWWGALLLVLALAGCSAAQWARTKAHAVEVGTSMGGGAVAVLVPWPLGFALGLGIAVVGVVVSEELQPPSKTRVVTKDEKGNVTDVTEFDTKEGKGAPSAPAPWWQPLWGALRVVWWVCVAAFVLANAKLRGALLGVLGWLCSFAWRKAVACAALFKKKGP